MTDTIAEPPRKRRSSSGWLLTFSDLMALLVALFVLILSFSELNSDSFRRNAASMADAFNNPTPSFVAPQPQGRAGVGVPGLLPQRLPTAQIGESILLAMRREEIVQMLRGALFREISQRLVAVEETDTHVTLRFPAAEAFNSGSADLRDEMIGTIARVAEVLTQIDSAIVVSGHTDDLPIGGGRYLSNWELSTARATAVVHRLLENPRIAPARISAAGHADTRPLADNRDPDGRAANRRVEVRVDVPVR